MADNQQWLDAGLTILEQDGSRALTIERLSGQVGLSKGSFYHHFGGMAGYKNALLAHYESAFTTQYIDAVEQGPHATPLAKLEALLDMACDENDDPRIEVALRAWALQDPVVHEAQERIDQRRVDYLRGLWLELTGDDEQAARMGQLLYLIVIGAGQIMPPVPQAELRRLYELTLERSPLRVHFGEMAAESQLAPGSSEAAS